ncbi:protein Wnt-6-like isoform X6 [Bombus pyrosoma]|uniref:protein Wnt-6-like isoform X6 n=1 Tax=Bombus pyrosoma TaxID=396416 RepID=UPI001CB9C558|nr:protein Wnt-6-like isoform X6 [Bombus pyrosoma]
MPGCFERSVDRIFSQTWKNVHRGNAIVSPRRRRQLNDENGFREDLLGRADRVARYEDRATRRKLYVESWNASIGSGTWWRYAVPDTIDFHTGAISIFLRLSRVENVVRLPVSSGLRAADEGRNRQLSKLHRGAEGMEMRLVLVAICLLLVTPIAGSFWTVGNQVVMDPMLICKKTRRLKGKMADICRKEPSLLKEIARGVQVGTKECQYQFRNRRWNCTTMRRSLRKILLRDTRETGFVNAITAAGVTYAVTRACTMGHLVECSCDKMTAKGNRLGKLTRTAEMEKSLPTEGDWEWGGCGDNVKFGFKKSRDFMDAPYRKRSDIKTLVKLHNNNAGRLAIRDFMSTECKCHGLSGSCTVRTCWRKMPAFRDVGNRLKESFDGAAKVIPSNDGHSFITEGPTIKPPDRFDLIYSEDSPDFCKPNRKTGSLGTQGRRCNSTSQGVDGCELLCCGRGYDTRVVKEKISCECRFRWCCEVTCNTCLVKKTVNTCR